MRYRFCPHCGMRYVSIADGNCPHCGRPLGRGGETEDRPPQVEAAQPAPAPPTAQASVSQPAPGPSPPPLQDGQFRCPYCGEALYRGEQVCWNCGRRVESEAKGQAPAAAIPPAPESQGGWRAEGAPAEYVPPPSGAAMSDAYWALGLGLASALTCGLGFILGPIALWLGIRALRRGAGGVAVAGIVFGAIGTFVGLVVWGALVLFVLVRGTSRELWIYLPTARGLAQTVVWL